MVSRGCNIISLLQAENVFWRHYWHKAVVSSENRQKTAEYGNTEAIVCWMALLRCVRQNVKIIWLAVSLGGPETLMEHPATMSHGPTITDGEECTEVSIADGLIRMRYASILLYLYMPTPFQFDITSVLNVEFAQRDITFRKYWTLFFSGFDLLSRCFYTGEARRSLKLSQRWDVIIQELSCHRKKLVTHKSL